MGSLLMPCLKASKASRSCGMQLAPAAPAPRVGRSCSALDVRNVAAETWWRRSLAGCMVGKTMSSSLC
jgi:hypothetical protein